MNDSSDEEININRKRKQQVKKQALVDLFEEENVDEDSVSSADYGERDSLFLEIFGTGEEYNYVLEGQKSESSKHKENVSMTNEVVDAEDVYVYAQNNLKVDQVSLKKVINLLSCGYSIHFALLHTGIEGIGIEDGYTIVDVFYEYKEFVKLKGDMKKKYGDDVLLHNINSIRELRWYSSYKQQSGKDIVMPNELLSVEDFCENIRMAKRVYEPGYSSVEPSLGEVDRIATAISCHPTFRNVLYSIHKQYGIEDEDNGIGVDNEIIERVLIEMYQSDMASDYQWNNHRRRIVLVAMEKACEVIVPLVLEEKRNKDAKRKIFLNTIDRIVNGSIGIKREGMHICGITEEKRYFKAVILDFEGEFVESIVVKDSEEFKLLEFFNQFNPCSTAVSGSTTLIKRLMKIIMPWNPVYVENRVAMMSSNDTYAFCCSIARLIICPEIEYAELISKGIVYLPQESLSRKDAIETIRRGILTAISAVGVDANYLLKNSRNGGLLSLISNNLCLKERFKELRNVQRLEDLASICDNDVEYTNLVVYLRVNSGIFAKVSQVEPFDSTCIHPRNYEICRDMCKSLYDQLEFAKKPTFDYVRELLNNHKNVFMNPNSLDFAGTSNNKALLDDMCGMLALRDRALYSGLPDHFVFKELTGSDESLIGKTFEASVVKCGDTYYLLSSACTSAAIYVKKSKQTEELFLNQLVMVKIECMNCFMLSYTGSIVVQEHRRSQHYRFMTHPLFRNLNSEESECYLRDKCLPLVLRASKNDGSPIVVLKILDDVYVHMKVVEDEKYCYKECIYDSLDEFISKVTKKILMNVKSIKDHKYYFENEGSLLEYLGQGGSYIRYGFYFSRKYSGKICMMYSNGRCFKEYITVNEHLVYEGMNFATLDEFMRYRKSI
ncbi:transcriptional accessory-like protein [Ordospora colligata]|nr:transcriptional accessory-like protein [Ordospora colligata]